jgi:hypothetical protein
MSSGKRKMEESLFLLAERILMEERNSSRALES